MQRKLLLWAVTIVIGIGLLLGGYWIYVFFEDIFETNNIPLFIRFFVVAGGLGFVLLFMYVIWEKLRQYKG